MNHLIYVLNFWLIAECSKLIRPELVPGEAEQGRPTTAAAGEPPQEGQDHLPPQVSRFQHGKLSL